jgi:uncharacterized protein YndB with AHSA1/START domain
MSTSKNIITVRTTINAPIEVVWKRWTTPNDIIRWNFASPDWHTPRAENDLRPGGTFVYRMEAKNGSVGFDFTGSYGSIRVNESIEYTIGDGRKVIVKFIQGNNFTDVIEMFEAQGTHSIELQQAGWQSILNNFRIYTESFTSQSSKTI